MSPPLREEIERMTNSSDKLRASVESLASHVATLSEDIKITQSAQIVLEKTQSRVKAVLAGYFVAAAVIFFIVFVLWELYVKVNENTEDISDLQKDIIQSQCSTTGFFLQIGKQDQLNPPKNQTQEDIDRLTDFIKTYQKSYDSLDCSTVLGTD